MTQLFTVGVAVNDWLVPFVRGGWAFMHDRFDQEQSVFANVEVGASAFVLAAPELRVGGHVSVFLPVGSGQGIGAPGLEQRAQTEGARTRMGMDAPLFAVGYFGFAGTLAMAYVRDGLIAQAELGIEPLIRTGDVGPDGAIAVMGSVHLGYFVIPELSFAIEATHHQWAVQRPPTGAPEAITSILVGVRAHATVANVVLRPGLSYSHALGGPAEQNESHVLQLDLVADL